MKVTLFIISFLFRGTAAEGLSLWRQSSSSGSGETFNDGVYIGFDEAEHIWMDNGNNCSFIWSFQDEVDAL